MKSAVSLNLASSRLCTLTLTPPPLLTRQTPRQSNYKFPLLWFHTGRTVRHTSAFTDVTLMRRGVQEAREAARRPTFSLSGRIVCGAHHHCECVVASRSARSTNLEEKPSQQWGRNGPFNHFQSAKVTYLWSWLSAFCVKMFDLGHGGWKHGEKC